MNKLDEYAKKYINPDKGLEVDKKFLDVLAKKILGMVEGPKVLEMGVGMGTYSDKIIKKFGHSYVVDGAQDLLNNQKEKFNDKITTYCSYFEKFNPSIKFNTVLSTNVLEHVDNPVLVLKQIKSWLCDDGKIIIVVPNANSLHRNYGVCLDIMHDITELGNSDIKVGHQRVYTFELLKEHINEAGLKINKVYPSFIKLLSNAQMSEFSEKQITALFDLAEKNIELLPFNADIFVEVTL